MRRRRHRNEDQVDINLAPMVDMIFILLIFFIATASFVRETAMDIKRPEAKTAEQAADAALLVGVTARGEVVLNGKKMDLRALRPLVERHQVSHPGSAAVVVADRDCPTGITVRVLDICRQAGIKNVSVGATVGGTSPMTIWRPLGALTGASAITLAICLLIPMLGTQRTPPLQPEETTVPLVPLPAPEQQTRPKPTTAPTAAPLMRAPAIAMPKLSLPTLPAPQQTGGVTLPAIIGTEALSLSAPSAPETGDLKVDGPAYDTPPRVRTRIDPFYPPSALRAGVQGSVLVRVLINEEGRVTEAHVVRSEPAGIFDASALKAVRRWRFYPAKRFGNPVAVRIDIPIRFRRHR